LLDLNQKFYNIIAIKIESIAIVIINFGRI